MACVFLKHLAHPYSFYSSDVLILSHLSTFEEGKGTPFFSGVTLNLALDDEYKALATYQAVIEKFGQVKPFVDIAQSEQRHIDALTKQYEKYGIPVPENPWPSNVPEFDSAAEACQAGIEAEKANAELYERLFEMTDNRALLNVFTNLSRASQESHLPAFEDC